MLKGQIQSEDDCVSKRHKVTNGKERERKREREREKERKRERFS